MFMGMGMGYGYCTLGAVITPWTLLAAIGILVTDILSVPTPAAASRQNGSSHLRVCGASYVEANMNCMSESKASEGVQ